MKKLIAIISILLITTSGFSQAEFGVKFGVDYGYVRLDQIKAISMVRGDKRYGDS